MPRVGKKKFPYTKQGIADAKAYAKKNDLPIIYTEDNKAGMSVPGYAEGGGVRFYETQYTAPAVDFHKPEGYSSGDGMGMGSGSGRGSGQDGSDEPEYVEPGSNNQENNQENNQNNIPEDEPIFSEEELRLPEDDMISTDNNELIEIPEVVEKEESDEELGIKKPVEQENLNQKPKVVKKPSDEYIPQSTFGEGENPNIGRAEGSYSHEARNMIPQTQRNKIELPKSDTGGGGGLANLTGGGDGESLADKIKDKTSGDGGGGGLADLGDKLKEKTEEMGDGITAKKGAMVKTNKKKRFPDLNKDGKITRADVLKGRGVFKHGGKVKPNKKNKKGMAIIIAIGRPKANRKKK